MRREKGEKCVKKGENHSDPIYTNPIKNLPTELNPNTVRTNFCTGDFAPPKPEFGAELCDSDPNSHPPKIHLPEFNPEIAPKNSHCTSAGPFG